MLTNATLMYSVANIEYLVYCISLL